MTMRIMNCSVAKSMYKLIDVLELEDSTTKSLLAKDLEEGIL
jgi:hypothetical protein